MYDFNANDFIGYCMIVLTVVGYLLLIFKIFKLYKQKQSNIDNKSFLEIMSEKGVIIQEKDNSDDSKKDIVFQKY